MPIPRHRSTYDTILATSMVAAALEPMTMNLDKTYPCDSGPCPFGGEDSSSGMFCRNMCGLGVDEDTGGDY